MSRHYFTFGPFTLNPSKRLLERDGKAVKISGRALDLLTALIAQPGDFLSNEDLMRLVWGPTAVDEGSVRVHMSGLRKALGESQSHARCIVNVSGKGYSFVGDFERHDVAVDTPPLIPVKKQALPAPVAKVFGRDSFCELISDELPASRFITIVGPGGVGKTTVALSVANAVQERYRDGVLYVDLSATSSSEQVPAAIMSALGAGAYADNPMSDIQYELSRMNLLLVLDSCEHVIDAAASVSEGILRTAPEVHLLATSREPLNAEGEWVRRLQPLPGPVSDIEVVANVAISYPAIEMFVARAIANDPSFGISDENAPTIAELCRRLDGLPLAIEFAASRIEEFGLEGVAERLGDRFALLSKGRRTALPRHRTLRQTLDWSYELLSENEAKGVRILSLFLAPFSVIDAASVMNIADTVEAEQLLGGLASKSMLSVVREPAGTGYRLLDMTREYGRLKLSEVGEAEGCFLSHAKHCLELLKLAEKEWDNGLSPSWLWRFGRRVWDVRQAIDWALSSADHVGLGIELTAHSAVLFTSLGMVDQHRSELERAISANAKRGDRDPIMDARMFSSLGNVLYQVQGNLKDEAVREAFQNAVAASRRAGDKSFEVRSLSGLSASYIIRGRHPDALALEDELIAAGGVADHAVQRTLAHSTFFEGLMSRAKVHIENALGTSFEAHDIRKTGAQFDHRMVTLRSTLAAYLFLSGRPEAGMSVVKECVDDISSLNHPISLCHMICGSGFPISFALGGPDMARPFLDLLARTAQLHSIGTWKLWAVCYDALMVPRERRVGTQREAVLHEMSGQVWGTLVEFMSILGEDYVEPAFVDAALATPSKWCRPELIRVRAALDLRAGGRADEAEKAFREAVEMSKAGEMITWELRSATSLAELLIRVGKKDEGLTLLTSVMDKVTDGFDGRDFKRAAHVAIG